VVIAIGIQVRLCSSNQYCNRVGNCSVQCANRTRNRETTVSVCMPCICAWYACLCDSLTSLWSALNLLATKIVLTISLTLQVVKMFTQLDSITDCRDILTTVVKVATRFVHIVMHFCAYAQLGVQKSSHHGNKVGAEWGGLEGIGRELSSLSDEISRLEDATDPQKASYTHLHTHHTHTTHTPHTHTYLYVYAHMCLHLSFVMRHMTV